MITKPSDPCTGSGQVLPRQRVRDRDIEWIVGDAESYPLPEEGYDAIISQMGLMFFTNNAKAFANLRTRLASVFECDGPYDVS